jgi:hypothetical protein
MNAMPAEFVDTNILADYIENEWDKFERRKR